MGRGAQAQTQQMIDQQLAQQNAMNQQLYSSTQAMGSQAAAGYQNLLANPGYSPAEQSAITNLSQSALSSSFDALAQNAATRAAQTRNSAGYGELLDSLARTQGQQSANLAQQNQLAFADASKSDTMSALSGLSGLYGTDSSLLGPHARHPRRNCSSASAKQRAEQPRIFLLAGLGTPGARLEVFRRSWDLPSGELTSNLALRLTKNQDKTRTLRRQ